MANILSKTGITDGLTIQPHHVTQSIDAFTATAEYDISLSGSLVLDLNGGYQMTASSGNYTSVIDPGTGTLFDGAAYTDGKGLITNFKGTYSPITSSLYNGELFLVNIVTASGHISDMKYSGSLNSIINMYQDWSQAFPNPAGTNINFVIELTSDGDVENNTYATTIGKNVFAGGARGIYLQGSDDSGVGAYLTINESSNTGFRIGSNESNASDSDLFQVVNESNEMDLFIVQNNGMIILPQVSSSLGAADDADAALLGVPLGGLYHTDGTIKIRLE